MWFNPFMIWLIRSPFHRLLSKNFMVLIYTGRKSGKTYQVPVNYTHQGNRLVTFSYRERTWWRNLKGGASLKLRLRGQELNGFGEVLLDEPAVAVQIGEYVRHLPISARSLGVQVQAGQPDPADLARLAQERVMIRIKLV